MNHRRSIAAIAAATALGLAAPVGAASAAPAAERDGNRSLAAVLNADGDRFDRNWHDFDIVHRAVTTVLGAKPGSDVGVLTKGRTRVTAFVPTDRAFRKLAYELTGRRAHTERGTFRLLARNVDVATLETVLLYHVVPGATITYRQARAADGAALTTAAGLPVKVNVVGHQVRLRDRDFDDRNPRVIRPLRDLNKGNKQIAHGIDRVLRPVNLP
jgi:uncharacterized surface protein with fasciclin (FAS1) repeats